MNKSSKTLNSRQVKGVLRGDIVSKLSKDYNVSIRFVHMAIRGERESEKAMDIRKEYNSLASKIKEILK